MFHARAHDPGSERSIFYGVSNSTGGTHEVDGAHMIFVPAIGKGVLCEIDAKGSTKESTLDIVNRERISRDEEVNVSAFDHPLEIFGRAGVHDRRSGYDQNFSFRFGGAFNFAAILPNR